MTVKVMSFDLNKHIFRLLQDEPFFAALSRRIDKRETLAVPTAGIGINPDTGHFEMFYNPEYFGALTDQQKAGVIKHEFYHLVFEHVTERLPEEGMTPMWNVATDLAINGFIRHELPPKCCIPGVDDFIDLPLLMTAEWYFEELKKKKKEDPNFLSPPDPKGSSAGESQDSPEGQFDNHDAWGKSDAQTREIAKERFKEMSRKAVEECDKGRGWGSLSHSVKEQIRTMVRPTAIDWRKMLRYFVRTSQTSSKRSSIKRINRRFPYIHAGKKSERQARIAISIDQSGSVNDSLLELFFSELESLAKIAEFVVVPFDDTVCEAEVFVWKKGERRKHQRILRGGTDFNAPTDYVNKHKFDGHLILTDMYAPMPKPSKCQRAWITDSSGASMPYFKTKERVLVLK
jgi:predicted metal-dependent peptidase|tara:strand:+ start:35297 stop:36499 length:1203 start_codon:yes stop_codon:yes gene_type:complete